MMPHRIQRKRTKGWRMPPSTVYVGRPTKWGNPFRGQGQPAEVLTEMYAHVLENDMGWPLKCSLEEVRRELRGKNLACWCPLDQPCHADVLLELANREEADDE